ncbi:MAG: TRAP transporter substrate-binding protein [Deltaproteobacteria bacterium]|nr:TRAP transporter substrate-binding protein [Deltaproteobacteria bacterium]
MKSRSTTRMVIAALAALLFGASAEAAPEKLSIGFAHIWPASHFTQAEQLTRYFKMVERATKGKYVLDVKWYPVGTLIGGSELYDGVVKGIVDAGTSSFGYTPGRFPVMLALNEPGIAPPESADAAARAVWEHYNKWKPKELQDVKVLYLYATGPGWMHTKKPVRSVDDMKGLKIRVTRAGTGGVKAVGGEPVAMVMGETYLAAQKGTIDALISPLETLQGWKHNEVFQYSTFVPQFYSEFFYVVMNQGKWKSLPKDLQDAFDSVAEEAVKEAGQIWEHNQKRGMEYAKREGKGHEFLQLSKQELARLTKLLDPVRGQYIAQLKSKGLPGEDIVNSAAKVMDKHNEGKYEPWKP